jgi:Putative neutral zinc metallopeptidase
MDTLVFYVVMGLTYLFSLVVRKRLNSAYSKYSRVPNHAGLSGGQVARDILDSNGLRDVQLELARGTLTDHYDPRTRVIRLSLGNARSASVAAMAVSAHEAGHALQDADDYAPLEIRTSILPLVQAGHDSGFHWRLSDHSSAASRCFFWERLPTSALSCFISSRFRSSSTPAGFFRAVGRTAASSRRLTGPLGRHAFDDFATGRFTKKEILVRSLSEPAAKLIPDSQALQQASARHGPALSRRRRRR